MDRDGTVVVDPPDERVDSEEKVKFFPDSISALKKLQDDGFSIIFVTNQAGIAEGRIDTGGYERIQNKVLSMLEAGGVKILKTYLCPHGQSDGCDCRKPKPTLLLQAAKDFDVDLRNTYMVGDRDSDVLAGKNAGAKAIQVDTATNPHSKVSQADYQAKTLTDAVEYIIANT